MSSDAKFRCPVCRAQQPLQDDCRRCQADLRLVVRAHRRIAYLVDLQRQQGQSPDPQTSQTIRNELRLLAPRK